MIVGSPQFEAFGTARLARESRRRRRLARLPPGTRAPVPRSARRLHGHLAVDARPCRRTRHRRRPDRGRWAAAQAADCRRRSPSAATTKESHCAHKCSCIRCSTTAPRFVTDHEGRGAFVWTPSSNRFGWTAYLGREPRMSDAPEYAAPARRDDLSGLPPAWIGVGELDLFYEEDVAYAEKLTACGVAVRAGHRPRDVSRRRRAARRKQLRCRIFTTVHEDFLRSRL